MIDCHNRNLALLRSIESLKERRIAVPDHHIDAVLTMSETAEEATTVGLVRICRVSRYDEEQADIDRSHKLAADAVRTTKKLFGEAQERRGKEKSSKYALS